MADNFNFVQLQDLRLAGSGISLSDTTIVLQSMKLIDGITDVTTAMFGALGMAVLEPDTSREENISFTTITQNTNGTATLTGVTRGLDFKAPYTTVSANRRAHAGGSIMRISNTAPFYNQIAVKDNDESILGAWVFPSAEPTRPKITADVNATDATSLVTLGQLGRTAAAGAANASTTVNGISEIATQDEVDDGTATGGTGATVVTPASTITEARLNVQRYVAGENIDASTVPQAVYLKESDGRVYKTDATSATEAIFSFIGFAILGQNITTGNTIRVQTDGLVAGFTGLTLGGYYFLTNTVGTISTTAGTFSLRIGRAVTATKLIIGIGKKVVKGLQSLTTTGSTTITVGFRPDRVLCYANGDNSTNSSGEWNPHNANMCVASVSTISASYNNFSWSISSSAGNFHQGVIDTITNTGFNINNTKTNTPTTGYLLWIAEANN